MCNKTISVSRLAKMFPIEEFARLWFVRIETLRWSACIPVLWERKHAQDDQG
uniref:Uncharacterized protein n=1 Tax=Candidatus Kentrum sp. MB TaxID=2138164 RepID=A0A450X2H2_9GAMM|nr:MAG: hypothetical protein BECKMB1821G_GA0114241_100512 [Candidatus Kentron sp. MB]VFK27871.1 MAG: hypothetical protein BECKMB1821I_GA0114274_100512 [Candidatus Kentron sp. MB]VFK74447.1 MAG: hypothetical protein BECKMB1821H_GA0114242_100512 [Candidatus Kentron sp. MB]